MEDEAGDVFYDLPEFMSIPRAKRVLFVNVCDRDIHIRKHASLQVPFEHRVLGYQMNAVTVAAVEFDHFN